MYFWMGGRGDCSVTPHGHVPICSVVGSGGDGFYIDPSQTCSNLFKINHELFFPMFVY